MSSISVLQVFLLLFYFFAPCVVLPAAFAVQADIYTSQSRSSQSNDVVQAGTATEKSAIAKVDELTKQIIGKEIDLESFYMRYRVLGTSESKYRFLRYWILQQTAASLVLGSNLTYVSETGKNLSTPQNVSANVIKGGITTGMIGSIFQGGSSAIELSSNGLECLKNKFKKMDPKTARLEFVKQLNEIDDLLAERQLRMQALIGEKYYPYYATEGNLLKIGRDWCLWEFADVYATVRSYQPSNNVYYFLDVAASSIYLASNTLALGAFKQPELGGTSSIVAICGDTIGIASAPTGVFSYKYLYKYWQKRLAKQVHEKPYNPEGVGELEMKSIKTMLAQADADVLPFIEPIRARLHVYEEWYQRDDEFLAKQMIDIKHGEKVALQSAIAGPMISGTYLSQDIIGCVSSYKYKNNLRRSNTLGFASSIAPTVGSSSILALSALWYIDAKKHEKNLRKHDAMPEDLLRQRLTTLKDLKCKIDGTCSNK